MHEILCAEEAVTKNVLTIHVRVKATVLLKQSTSVTKLGMVATHCNLLH